MRLGRRDILELANHMNRTKVGDKNGIKDGDPEYRILEPIVSEEACPVAMKLQFRRPKTFAQIIEECQEDPNCKVKDPERIKEILLELAYRGVYILEKDKVTGEDTGWTDLWVPGTMEMVCNVQDSVDRWPELAQAFDDYGTVRGARTAGAFPVGMGLMRVIPIQSSVEGNSKAVSLDLIEEYIKDETLFSVSNCSCRTVREALGEGCGHLKEDMCIQIGHGAEYYIRTGRGRQITKEEALEICRKAEENGMVHQIPNTDGPGHTHAICNCCGCGCLSLRTGNMFKNTDMIRSNFISKVEKDKCVACGQCVENCPTNAIKLGQKICSATKVVENITTKVTPREYKWTPDKYDPDYRIHRENVVETGTAPCKSTCPAHISVQGYIKLASQGRYLEALDLIKKENPFPAVCGRICPHACETECTRNKLDEPIAIDEIKKFIADKELVGETRFVPMKKHDYSDKKVAIVGAGPSGLSCAYYLAIDNYDVTVFDKEAIPGGMLTLGIPEFRLEKNVVEAEIDVLEQLGVKFKMNTEVGKDVTLDELRKDGFKAFYMAIGAQNGRKIGVEGEDAEGVISGVDFLRSINLGNKVNLEGDCVVIGGGNVAIDVARAAIRTNASNVQMFCLESREEMPALDEEIEEAEEEEIKINNSYGPKKILVENGKVVGIEMKKCLSVFETVDGVKRFSPKFDENDVITVKCSNVLLSVGQAINWGDMLEGSKCVLNRNNTIQVDKFTFQSDQPDIFAGGDCYSGPSFAINAIADGKQAAISIHRFVQKGQSLLFGRDRRIYKSLDTKAAIIESFDNMPRQKPGHTSVERKSFKDNRLTFTEEQMKKETERCLGCGAAIVDEYMCVGCGQCTTKCKFDAIHLERRYDNYCVPLKELMPEVKKHVVKRAFKIANRKIKDTLGFKKV